MSSTNTKRRNFTASFKADVVLSLISGEKTQAELCREHSLSSQLLGQWSEAFLGNAAAAFKSHEENSADSARIAELEPALGRSTLENEILKKGSRLLIQSKGGRS